MAQELKETPSKANTAELLETLGSVSSEVMETMFFSEALATECEHTWAADAVSARVAFSGSHYGEMLLCVSPEVVSSLASGFLGQDLDETSEEQRRQVILELANILCGAVLSRLWPESSLQLEAPEAGQWEICPEGAMHCCFELPEGKLATSVRMRGQDFES
jgi:CheY-specific phosphatase CheX